MTPQLARSVPIRHVPEPHSRTRVARLLEATTRHCHVVEPARAAAQHARERAIEIRHERLELPRHAPLHTGLAFLLLAAAGLIDTLVSGSLIAYLAGQRMKLSPFGATLAQWGGPLLVLALEVIIAIHIAEEKRERLPGERPTVLWKVLGALCLAGMLAAGIAGALAKRSADGGDSAHFTWMNVAMICFTLVPHILVLANGRLFETAWHNIATGVRLSSANSAARAADERAASGFHTARRSFEGYFADRADYNRKHPEYAIEPGPFDATTCRVLREIYGRDIVTNGGDSVAGALPSPAGPAPRQPDPQQAAAPAAASPAVRTDGDGDAENAYLRNALDAAIRNRDGELGPAPSAANSNARRGENR